MKEKCDEKCLMDHNGITHTLDCPEIQQKKVTKDPGFIIPPDGICEATNKTRHKTRHSISPNWPRLWTGVKHGLPPSEDKVWTQLVWKGVTYKLSPAVYSYAGRKETWTFLPSGQELEVTYD